MNKTLNKNTHIPKSDEKKNSFVSSLIPPLCLTKDYGIKRLWFNLTLLATVVQWRLLMYCSVFACIINIGLWNKIHETKKPYANKPYLCTNQVFPYEWILVLCAPSQIFSRDFYFDRFCELYLTRWWYKRTWGCYAKTCESQSSWKLLAKRHSLITNHFYQ